MLFIKNQKGFSLVELMVAITFISVIVVLIFNLTSVNNKLRRYNEEKGMALVYAANAMEAVKLLSWDELIPADYHLVLNGEQWELSAGSELLENKYTRTVTISDVYRENSTNGQVHGEISETGFWDPDTKQITISVSWPSILGNNQTQTLETYLYQWQASRQSQNDWSGGDGQAAFVDETRYFSSDSGIDISTAGIATLQSGFLNWNQATTTAYFDTPGTYDQNDVFAINNKAYLVTQNNSSGAEFFILDVSNKYSPQQLSSLNIGATVTAVVVKDDYAYLSTYHDNAELTVVDISNPYGPSIVETYNLSGTTNAYDVAVSETEVYLARGSYIYSFSITDPENVQYLDSIGTDNTAREIYLSEDNLYVATENSTKELQIFQVTNPANLNQIGEYNLPGSLLGTDVAVRGNRAYFATQNNSSGSELFILDISAPASPLLLGDYNAGARIYSLAVVGPYVLLGAEIGNKELVVVDGSYPATINEISSFDLEGYIQGMSANCSIIYAATTGNSREFFIISTEVADCGYTDAGILESSTFDTGASDVAYNWIAWSGSQPLNTQIKFQLATSNNANGPWNFVGPDASSGTYYTTAAQEYINYNYHLNQRYFRYRLYLSSASQLQGPVLEEVTISYSTYP